MARHAHRALSTCPVCAGDLVTTRLGCPSCGTELVGEFAPCPFCALDDADLELLRVFLASRGNLKELEKHLGVSYPTARARFGDLLAKLGLGGPDADLGPDAEPEGVGSHAVADGASEASGAPDARSSAGAAAGEPGGSAAQSASAGPEDRDAVRDQVLAQVASGALAPDVAADLLWRLG